MLLLVFAVDVSFAAITVAAGVTTDVTADVVAVDAAVVVNTDDVPLVIAVVLLSHLQCQHVGTCRLGLSI